MPTYTEAPKEVLEHLETVIGEYRPDIEAAGVTVTCLIALGKPEKKTGIIPPCLKAMGMPAVGRIRVTSHEARVAGQNDCIIHLDGAVYPSLPPEQQEAILHGLVYRLELAKDEESGAPITDDCCRPKMTLRPPDFLVCGYDAVLKRHGKASVEGGQLVDFGRRLKQLELTFDATE